MSFAAPDLGEIGEHEERLEIFRADGRLGGPDRAFGQAPAFREMATGQLELSQVVRIEREGCAAGPAFLALISIASR